MLAIETDREGCLGTALYTPSGSQQHLAGIRHRLLRRGRAPARTCTCTAPRNGREARLLQFGAGVAVDFGAKRNFDDLRGSPVHTPFLQTVFRIIA
jgi:hypothetical protein